MKYVFFVLILAGSLLGCSKGDSKACSFSESQVVAPAAEVTAVQAYLTANSITATQHSSGMFYTVTAPGSGNSPSICSTITVKYTGRLLSGSIFDSNTVGTQFQLGQLIAGWQKGLPLIKRTGTIRMYVPPSLGYGPNPVRDNLGNVVIPGSSILIFDVELLEVQ